jgi:hypothetical protein
MQISNEEKSFLLKAENYSIKYDAENPFYLNILFNSGIGANFFVASGCDHGDGVDELIELGEPELLEENESYTIKFKGKTTLWDSTEYYFKCTSKQVVYGYTVHGNGKLETVRFFEGFQFNDPRINDAYYPYFCGPGRHLAHHRSEKEMMHSSIPEFTSIYSFCINSTDKRIFNYYEDNDIRVNGDRSYYGGDWLATPSPFLFLMGNKQQDNWVSLGLAVKPGDNRFMGYKYCGGEGFGLELTGLTGYTEVKGSWESPEIVISEGGSDVYESLDAYVDYLQKNGCMKSKERSDIPLWWKKPIFGGWGEQVFHSNRWENYFSGEHDDWKHDNVDKFCTQKAYEEMLETLESKNIDPTILIIDNRWFDTCKHLDVDAELWPDLKGFIADQHTKGRKVILWVSPWGYCKSSKGKDVPMPMHMFVDEDDLYDLELDTDIFFPACKMEHKKKRKYYPLPGPSLTDANWRYVADPHNPDYVARLKNKIKYLLSPEGLDADGFEFDYTHFLPKFRGTKPITEHGNEITWGVEALHHMISIFYNTSKEVKSDALIISHTFNPYFNDIIDMLRLQDIYTDRRSIVPQMTHRAKIAHRVAPGCVVHTDQHPMPSLEAWREFAVYQKKIGNPCTYYVTGIETTRERFTEEDYQMLAKEWEDYNILVEKGYYGRL